MDNDNNGMGGEYEEVTEGAPFMVIEDQHNIVDMEVWEELVRAYNGGMRLCNDKSYRKKEIKS